MGDSERSCSGSVADLDPAQLQLVPFVGSDTCAKPASLPPAESGGAEFAAWPDFNGFVQAAAVQGRYSNFLESGDEVALTRLLSTSPPRKKLRCRQQHTRPEVQLAAAAATLADTVEDSALKAALSASPVRKAVKTAAFAAVKQAKKQGPEQRRERVRQLTAAAQQSAKASGKQDACKKTRETSASKQQGEGDFEYSGLAFTFAKDQSYVQCLGSD